MATNDYGITRYKSPNLDPENYTGHSNEWRRIHERAQKVVDELWNTFTSLWSLFSLLPIRVEQQNEIYNDKAEETYDYCNEI